MFDLYLGSDRETDKYNFRQIIGRNGFNYSIESRKASISTFNDLLDLLKKRISYLFKRSFNLGKSQYQIEYRFNGGEGVTRKAGKSICHYLPVAQFQFVLNDRRTHSQTYINGRPLSEHKLCM